MLVLDGEVIGGYQRARAPGEFRHNLKRGGLPEALTPTTQDQRLLDKLSPVYGFRYRTAKLQRTANRSLLRCQVVPRVFGVVQADLKFALCVRIGVEHTNVDTVQQQARGPSTTDDSTADNGGAFDQHATHPRFTSPSFSRTSCGVRVRIPMPCKMVPARSTS